MVWTPGLTHCAAAPTPESGYAPCAANSRVETEAAHRQLLLASTLREQGGRRPRPPTPFVFSTLQILLEEYSRVFAVELIFAPPKWGIMRQAQPILDLFDLLLGILQMKNGLVVAPHRQSVTRKEGIADQVTPQRRSPSHKPENSIDRLGAQGERERERERTSDFFSGSSA